MRFKMPITLSLVLASCAHNMPNKTTEVMPPTSTNWTTSKTDRIPSSSMDEENLADTFDILMERENPEDEFMKYLNRQKSMYLRGEVLLEEFDQELAVAYKAESPIDFENSRPYKKLLTLRYLNSRQKDRLTYFFIKLTDIAKDKSKSEEERKLVRRILKKFMKELNSQDPVAKLAYEDLKIHIGDAIRSRRAIGDRTATDSAYKTIASFKNDQDRVKTLKFNRAMLRAKGREEAQRDTEETEKIEQETDHVQLTDSQNERNPSSEKKFYPSTGTNGNMMGLIFPRGTWALTYDDGPNPTHTGNIIKNLENLGVKASFFWLAQNVLQYQSTVEQVKSNGHVLANHSWSHPQLPKLGDELLTKEINKSTEVESKAYGQPVEFFRCPYGAGNSVPRIRERIAKLNMIHVFWNVDTLDWQDKDPDSILERTKKQMITSGRGVVLFHDIHPQSVIASKKLIEWSKTLKDTDKAIRWVTVSQITKEMNGN